MTLPGNSQEPKVSVLMSVYNGERYLVEAIESILTQNYPDFEFLIIDDGSNDGTSRILADYVVKDPRVRVVPNDINIGLARCLNKGIKLARGEYIARMDCDDISLPERLAKQVDFLEKNPSVSCIAVKIKQIDANGFFLGYWEDDFNTTTSGEILDLMPTRNCIAHPGVMLRASTLSKMMYNDSLQNSQDYDLWMRLLASGHRIDKLDEVLLSYRITPASVTSTSNRKNPYWKTVYVKSAYLQWAFRTLNFGTVTRRVTGSVIRDLFYLFLFFIRKRTCR